MPISLIDSIAEVEPEARDGVCVVPNECIDLMLHARKGKYQSTQDRKNIKVRSVPAELAESLAEELDSYIRISDIHFARKAKKKRWHILDTNKPGFVDVVLKFAPSTALKQLVIDAGIAEKTIKYSDISVPRDLYPRELGFAPFAKAISSGPRWLASYRISRKRVKTGYTWPALIEAHINWWQSQTKAREYAADDIKYTRELYNYLEKPKQDNDDILTAYVAATRWKGFAVDINGVREAKQAAIARVTTRVDPGSVRAKLLESISPIERAILQAQNKTGISTSKAVLEELAANGNVYAKEVLDARKALKEIELYDKLLIAGRLHASLKVGGTLSNRMAGADGLNVQAINNLKRVRKLFPMAFPKELLSQGDFESFEVVIAEAVYRDANLRKDLLTCEDCSGEMAPYKLSFKCQSCGGKNAKKIHTLMGMCLYGASYEEVKASKSTEKDMYTDGKRGVFALLYGGTAFTIATKIGVSTEVAEKALEDFTRRYIGVGVARDDVASRFTALRQPGGIGTKVSYREPADYVENIFGFRRYFTLENLVIKRLFDLSSDLPPRMLAAGRKMRVTRRDREQTGDGAVRTALYAAAFAQQQANVRAAQNTVIQSSGAESTKALQVQICSIQPRGIHPWRVRAVQVHDSLSVVSASETEVKQISATVQSFVDDLRKQVPLLGIDWLEHATSWAD